MERVTLGAATRRWRRRWWATRGEALRWLAARGIRFRLMYERQAYETDGRFRFWGGLAVGRRRRRARADRACTRRRRRGAGSRCATRRPVEALVRGSGVVVRPRRATTLRARSVVLAAGGFESNPAMRAGYLGPNWDVAKVRGTPYNTGEVLRAALAAGAQPYGHWSGCHAIQWDRDAPPTGDLELTNRFSRQSYPVGIVVNVDGERFIDEGADFRNYTYAKYGAEVLRQPRASPPRSSTRARSGCCGRSTTRRRARPASTLRRCASSPRASGSTPSASSARSREYNAAIVGPASSTRRSRTGCAPRAWRCRSPTGRCRSRTPPFVAFPVTCGITFTFGGVRVDADARVLDAAGRADAGPVRRRRAGRRPVLPQLPGRKRPHGRTRSGAAARATPPRATPARSRSAPTAA